MCDSSTVIVQCVTCPDTGIGIVKAVVIRVEVTFFPSKMQRQQRPHTTGIIKVSGPIEVPQQFVYVAEVHVIMVHLVISPGISTNIPVAVLRCSPNLGRTCQCKSGILCRMRNRIRNPGYLTGGIVIKMSACAIVPTQYIAYISSAPTAQRHTPTDSSMQPHALFSPNAIGGNGKRTAKRIEIRIGSSNFDASGKFTASILQSKILYIAIRYFFQFVTDNTYV